MNFFRINKTDNEDIRVFEEYLNNTYGIDFYNQGLFTQNSIISYFSDPDWGDFYAEQELYKVDPLVKNPDGILVVRKWGDYNSSRSLNKPYIFRTEYLGTTEGLTVVLKRENTFETAGIAIRGDFSRMADIIEDKKSFYDILSRIPTLIKSQDIAWLFRHSSYLRKPYLHSR